VTHFVILAALYFLNRWSHRFELVCTLWFQLLDHGTQVTSKGCGQDHGIPIFKSWGCLCLNRPVARIVKTRRQTGRAPLPYPPLSSPPLPSHPSSPLRSRPLKSSGGGLGERCKLPQRGLGRIPSRNRFWCILALKSDIWWQQFWRFPRKATNQISCSLNNITQICYKLQHRATQINVMRNCVKRKKYGRKSRTNLLLLLCAYVPT